MTADSSAAILRKGRRVSPKAKVLALVLVVGPMYEGAEQIGEIDGAFGSKPEAFGSYSAGAPRCGSFRTS